MIINMGNVIAFTGNGDTNNCDIKASTHSVNKDEEQNAITGTFKPTEISEIPLGRYVIIH